MGPSLIVKWVFLRREFFSFFNLSYFQQSQIFSLVISFNCKKISKKSDFKIFQRLKDYVLVFFFNKCNLRTGKLVGAVRKLGFSGRNSMTCQQMENCYGRTIISQFILKIHPHTIQIFFVKKIMLLIHNYVIRTDTLLLNRL